MGTSLLRLSSVILFEPASDCLLPDLTRLVWPSDLLQIRPGLPDHSAVFTCYRCQPLLVHRLCLCLPWLPVLVTCRPRLSDPACACYSLLLLHLQLQLLWSLTSSVSSLLLLPVSTSPAVQPSQEGSLRQHQRLYSNRHSSLPHCAQETTVPTPVAPEPALYKRSSPTSQALLPGT